MIIMCRYTLGAALLGSYIYQPSNPYSTLIPSKPPTLGRRERGLEGKGVIDFFSLLPAD